MKLKKGILLIALTIIAISIMSAFSNVQAAIATTPLTLSIKALRSSGQGYQVVNNGTKYIWKIYNTSNDVNQTFYCIKGGPGFGSSTMGSSITAATYTRYFDMRDPDSITSTYLSALSSTSLANYEALMWVLDQCYVEPETNASSDDIEKAEEYKQALLDAVEEYAAQYPGVYDNTSWYNNNLTDNLTDDDIDAIQQLAIWYFTNDDEYHIDGNPSIYINATLGYDGSYSALDTSSDEDNARLNAMEALFAYLTKTPQQSGFSYDYTTINTSAPVEISDTTITFETSGDRIIVGPYKLEELRDINYSLTGTVTDGDGNTVSDVIYLDSTKTEVSSGTTLKDLIGEEFYISIPSTTNTSNIEFSISGNFYTTEITYWSVENPTSTDQPIVQIEKSNKSFYDSVSAQYEEVEDVNFDLALRKFIYSVNGTVLTGSDSREPQITTSAKQALADGSTYTVTKTHTKTPLSVSTGDKVVYTIRIYNEGNIDGYATEITDYLPDGLEFVSADESTINKTYGWTNPSGDGKTIVTTYLKDTLLSAFDDSSLELDYVDIQIECEVVATTQSSSQILKNIAEITAAEDIDGGSTDIDSDPDNVTTDPDDYDPQAPTKGVGEEDDDDYEDLTLSGGYFDLALRKFISAINDTELTGDDSREPQITEEALQELANGGTLTVTKTHTKDPISVSVGDTIVYTIRIYNEGSIAGYATEITDYLPDGLEFVSADESTINKTYGWTNPSGDGKTIVTTYLENYLLEAFDATTLDLDYVDIQIECKVVATETTSDQTLTNIAEITDEVDVNGNTDDVDSKPDTVDPDDYNPKDPTNGMGEQDDDDYEPVVLPGKYFDLSLRKFITSVTDSTGTSSNALTSRAPVVDVSPLVDGSSTTAIYNHTKDPVSVSNGDIVTYTIRVYNEGSVDGYVTEITDYLPSQLEFIVDDELNILYGWTVSSDGRTVTTTITSPDTSYSASRDTIYADRDTGSSTDKVLLKAFGGTLSSELDYIDVQIRCRVKDDIDLYEKITNIAEITGFTDSNGDDVTDRDSQEENVTLPTDETLPEYKDSEIESGDEYIPGQQDDDDFEKLVLQRFDLSLRKFITGVISGDTTTNITNRAPVFTKTSDTEYTYVHTKDPVEVAYGNIVIYTLRIYNEGNMDGYATTVKDDIPEGLEFLPDNSINTAFGWKMYTEDGTETTDVSKAVYIETDFLSKDNETEDGENLIKAYDPDTMTMPDYKDIKVAFKVIQPNTSSNIITNIAEITDDSDSDGNPIDDVDSTPDNDEPDEDDIDYEKIKVQYFDLSLRKWVTQAIVTCDGKTTVTESGNTAEDDPESPIKVEIQSSKLSSTTVKFKYSIRVTNEGDIAGYATEIKDYVPDGLVFNSEDNPEWTINDDGEVVTDQLKDTLLEPGESATVEIILTWVNGSDNLGEKVNYAEISEDDNEYDSPDIDSTPDNKEPEEDDIDEAPVVLSISTGATQTYMTLTLTCIAMLAGGIFLIKRFIII